MRLLNGWFFSMLLILPVPAFGQAMNPKELVGTWAISYNGEEWATSPTYQGSTQPPSEWSDSLKGKLYVDLLTLNADGSYIREVKQKEGDSLISIRGWERWKVTDRWEAAGDTLWLRHAERDDIYRRNPRKEADAKIRARLSEMPPTPHSTYLFQRKGQRLLLWSWLMWDAGRRQEQCAEAFEPFDLSKPVSMPSPRPITVRLADLIGTWTGSFETRMWGVVTDTLVIGADSTLQAVHYGKYDTANETGVWALLPGDILAGPLGNIRWVKVVLEDGMLVRCHFNYPVLKRIAP